MCAPEFGSFSGARFSFMREDIIPAAAQRYADTGSAPQITTPFSPKRRELPHRFPSGSVNDADQVLPGSGLEPEPDVQLSRPGRPGRICPPGGRKLAEEDQPFSSQFPPSRRTPYPASK